MKITNPTNGAQAMRRASQGVRFIVMVTYFIATFLGRATEAPSGPQESPVWYWQTKGEGQQMKLEVRLDNKAIFTTTFSAAQAGRSAIPKKTYANAGCVLNGKVATQPRLGLKHLLPSVPWVARSARPRALGHNPLGIETNNARAGGVPTFNYPHTHPLPQRILDLSSSAT